MRVVGLLSMLAQPCPYLTTIGGTSTGANTAFWRLLGGGLESWTAKVIGGDCEAVGGGRWCALLLVGGTHRRASTPTKRPRGVGECGDNPAGALSYCTANLLKIGELCNKIS